MADKIIECNIAVMNASELFKPKHDAAVAIIYKRLTEHHKEVLRQLVLQGPVEDGDVVSKVARDDLIAWGLAVRVCVRGEQGYTAAAYNGWAVHKGGNKEPNPAFVPGL